MQRLHIAARESTAAGAVLASPGLNCKLPHNSDVCSVTVLCTVLRPSASWYQTRDCSGTVTEREHTRWEIFLLTVLMDRLDGP